VGDIRSFQRFTTGRRATVNETRNPRDEHGRQELLDERLDAAVTDLRTSQPALPADRIAFHREMLMIKITESATTAAVDTEIPASSHPMGRRRRRLMLSGASAAVIGALVAGPAAAALVKDFIHRAPQSVQEADNMEVIYQGQSYTWAQIYDLQAKGKATITVEEPATYNKGQAYVFDTSVQADEWACTHVAGLAKRPICQAASLTPAPAPQVRHPLTGVPAD
jgi:hypothetical protein